MPSRRTGCLLLACWLVPVAALANTGTVFSPEVDAGERAAEYRGSYVPEDGASPDVYTHRLHYQHAFDDRWRARLIALQRSVDGDSFDYRYTRLELQWQYLEDQSAGWDAALRFEAQLGNGTPDRLRLAWTGKVDVGAGWQLRANALIGRQFGDGAASGLQMETRAQATSAIGSFDDQEHQLGPILKAKLGKSWSINASYLAGISDAADDGDWRLIIARDF